MQQFFLESPLVLGLSGALVVLALGFWWTQTGSRAAVLATAVAALLTASLVAVNWQVETDREQIRRAIDEVAEALGNNDVPRVVSYIHAGASAGVQRATQELPNYTFREARVTRLKSIVVSRGATPASAIAEFNVAVEIEAEGQRLPIRRFVKVYFVEQDHRWLVRDYEHFDPLTGLDAGE